MFDAYEVAIRLRLKDELSGVMGLINKQLLQANTHATELQGKLEKVGKLFSAGALVTGAGFGMAASLKAATNEAVRYEQQLNRLKALNLDMRFGAGSTASLVAQSQAIAKNTLGTTSTDALRLVTETQAITGSLAHTAELAPVLAKMRYGMEAYMSGGGKGEGHGAQAERQFADIVKVMEMRGLMRDFTGEKLEQMADLFVKNYAASGGMVKPSDFLAMMKTGGVAGKSVNQDFMFALGHIMQEAGGHRSGTQLMSLYQNMVAGRMPQQVAETLNKLGLLDAKHIHYGTTGHITKVDPGAMKNTDLLMSRPDLYLNQVILPALAAKGIDIKNQQQVLQSLNTMAGQRTATNLLAQLFLESGQIANYIAQAQGAKGYQALYDQGKGSTIGMQIDLAAKVNQLELDFGKAALPLLKSLLEQAIPLVKSLGDWMDKHPNGLKDMAIGFGALAASMMISGPLMMVSAGFKAMAIVLPLLSTGIQAATMPLLGALAALAAAGYVGSKIGQAAYSSLSDEHRTRGGHNVAALLALFGNKEAQDALDQEANNPNFRTGGGKPIQIHTQIHMDGRKVAQVVTEHQVRSASRPTSGTSSFDGSMTQRPVGASGEF